MDQSNADFFRTFSIEDLVDLRNRGKYVGEELDTLQTILEEKVHGEETPAERNEEAEGTNPESLAQESHYQQPSTVPLKRIAADQSSTESQPVFKQAPEFNSVGEFRSEPLTLDLPGMLSTESLRRVQQLASGGGGWPFLPTAEARKVICELLNSFRAMVFPNRLEIQASIRYGIRPLLYSILRRQFLAPRDFAACANTQCRDFFNLERAGQRFCSPECSRQQRQRTYWKKRGKKLREERFNRQRNMKR